MPDGYALAGGRGPHPKPKGYLTFGSSGLLYRSNKLMYDRHTDTLWHQLWGTPAFGSLVGSGVQLERLPVTLTTWEAWHTAHPHTTVMDFNTGFDRDYRVGAAYRDYFNSPDTMFPVWQRKDLLPAKSWIFTQLIDGRPKAYPLPVLRKELAVNDSLAGRNLVVIYDRGDHGARAFERKNHSFTATPQMASTMIVDETGRTWRVAEHALIGPNDEILARLPGHMAYWFGWFSFYPKTEVYGIEANSQD